MAGKTPLEAVLAEAHRRSWGPVVAATARFAGDLDLAEECAQDAFVSAVETWGSRGIPDNPVAWLITTARRKALDRLRRDSTLRRKLPLLIEPAEPVEGAAPELEGPVVSDDLLRLIFTCCHPALSQEAQVALTLRLLGGLSTAEIASAFLVSEATMAARLTRAKKKIAGAHIPYRVPPPEALPERLDSVLTVVHLLYTTGHTPPGPQLRRADLVDRALHLARVLTELMPDEPEARGLLALLLLTDARRDARTDATGRLVLLEDQDRGRWDRAEIDEGRALVLAALRYRPPGRFTLQAAIAAVHADASAYDETDWVEIVGLYDQLLDVWPSPVVALNRAVAVAMADGPEAGLAALAPLADDPKLAGYPYLPATKAELLRRLGRRLEAADSYRVALSWVSNDAEADFLRRRLVEVAGPI
jgi:RNA polymerase sigma-70 factor (ECF subfamily)